MKFYNQAFNQLRHAYKAEIGSISIHSFRKKQCFLRRNTLFIYRSFRGVIFLLCSCKCATFFPFVEKVDMTVIRNSEKAIVLQMNMVKKVQNLGCVL